MTKASDNPYPSILVTEGTEPSAPAAGKQRVYIDSTSHHLSRTDSSGTQVDLETNQSSGSVATDAIWDAAGDLVQGTGANTAAKLASGAAGTVLTSPTGVGSAVAWAVPRLTFSIGPFVLNDIPGTATTQMPLMYMNTTTAVSQGGATQSDLIMNTAGRVVGAILITDNGRTAGSAILQVRIAGTPTTFDSDSVALDAGHTIRDSTFLPYASGLAFAVTNSIGVALVTSGYTPTTGDALAWLIVSLDV